MMQQQSQPSSPLTKVIFIQRTAKYICRKVKDILILNSVNQDFQETIQDHQTFNLVFFKNVLPLVCKFNALGLESCFLEFSRPFLNKKLPISSAWMMLQATTLNEYDPEQQDMLRRILLHQAREGQHHLLTLDFLDDNKGEETSSPSASPARGSLPFLRHILNLYVRLGIAKEALESSEGNGRHCIVACVSRGITASDLQILLDHCIEHASIKAMLEIKTTNKRRACAIQSAVSSRLDADALEVLLSVAEKHAELCKILECTDDDGWTVLHVACAHNNLSPDVLQVLLKYCTRHVTNMAEFLQFETDLGVTPLEVALSTNLPTSSLQLLLDCMAEFCNVKEELERRNSVSQRNYLMTALHQKFPFESLKLFFKFLVKHNVDVATLLEEKDAEHENCLTFAAKSKIELDSLRIVVAHYRSDEAFQSSLFERDVYQYTPMHYFKTNVTNAGNRFTELSRARNKILDVLEDPECWRKCVEWWRKKSQ